MTRAANRLIHESSPYLQQHAYNPVDWYPWGSQALEKARSENKPILLSIGYAACHWCHVMAHESFEDDQTAALMNECFVNIKVDREERPDLDKIYQSTHFLLTRQSGGWPLTVFLTPDDLAPFFSGTYFPREQRYQLPAFRDVLKQIARLYQQRGADIKQQNSELLRILNPPPSIISDLHLNTQPVQHAIQALQNSFDAVHGGFNGAPKFPQASRLEFLLLNHSPMAQHSLQRMAQGGIYDQLEGGFYRYAVDEQWRIPHFEKMLYDNAQLLYVYALAWRQSREPLFAEVMRQTTRWAISTMQSPSGGFFSSLDADSDGQEGGYYLWDREAIQTLLDKDEYALIERCYGLDKPPAIAGRWHLSPAESLTVAAQLLDMPLTRAADRFASAKKKLLAARNSRKPPGTDTKILTASNALMIKGMLAAGSALDQPEIIDSAKRAIKHIRQSHWTGNRLFATGTPDQLMVPGYLDDYAFLIDALLAALEVEWDRSILDFAVTLADTMMAHFTDRVSGGFYFTADDHEQLLYRPKSSMDEALPSGNAVAARSLLVLGHLLGEPRYLQAAEKTLHAAWPLLTRYPAEHCSMLKALQDCLHPPQIVIIRGTGSDMTAWKIKTKTIRNSVFAIPRQEKDLPGNLAGKVPRTATCAYVCEGTRCRDVIDHLDDL
ncbi:hypothetical protein AQUSIP_14830 [Aquicella siphonis]|uniref:Spermatogenesis-associated protein 20-like TRX domain-containing protein n=1 Tax=Aquicella siphonis TaxID=254247 RepID=A0A5E4PIB8_9COXI|nr:thioredoxin domain-containing protein [Aquicella siphonis]VVC76177.1 hypothetical protein AQUSIP_14830 [Aquicella siphonis]